MRMLNHKTVVDNKMFKIKNVQNINLELEHARYLAANSFGK
jgi:hypothetical protein